MSHSSYILPLTSPTTLQLSGGKGASLARLTAAGFPVPTGFCLTTRAYEDFVAANQLAERILACLPADESDPAALEDASQRIRSFYASGKMLPELENDLLNAYRELGKPAVAVRSSATAEDLPELSFAGQQDTFLNVSGEDDLLEAVVNCWSSLWTGRAIGYRQRSRVPHEGIALAVIVQQMVDSRASGVLFSANPLSGLRSETVIDATLGLGEALVSGQVQPDHYVVNTDRGLILSKSLGEKALSIHARPDGGTERLQQDRSQLQALPDEQILGLSQLSQQVADLFDSPQDIEWAWDGQALFILQSRPITSLFPTPERVPPDPLKVFLSFGAVQGMLDPMTPLGRDSILDIFAMGALMMGVHATRDSQSVLYSAGERLWINFTPILSNKIGRRILPVVFNMVEPAVRQALEQIWDDPRLQPGEKTISPKARIRLARFALPMAGNILLNLAAPKKRREFIVQQGEDLLELMRQRCVAIEGDPWQKLEQQSRLLGDLATEKLPVTLRRFISGVAAGMVSWNLLNKLAVGSVKGKPPEQQAAVRDLVLQVTRGMPFNPTTEMDLNLWAMAQAIHADPAALQACLENEPAGLAQRYLSGSLPESLAGVVKPFLERYGGRGFCEIDLGRARWNEDPTHVFEMLASFLQIENKSLAPDVVFARGAASAQEAIDQLARIVRSSRLGWLKAGLVRFFAGRARQLMGARESPKFFAVRLMALDRGQFLSTGRELVQSGELEQPDDLFYLDLDELEAFTRREARDWKGLIRERRQAYDRELQRRQVPRLLLSDGRAFYEGISAIDEAGEGLTGSGGFHGSPVSTGSAQGRVRVVRDPRQAGLLPGEILVCPGTDPSWTPLFLSAAGLVMEVGGMMTHGAVVAREYGIPAIVGVDRATTRLHTGQLIRIDGSTGKIVLLDEN